MRTGCVEGFWWTWIQEARRPGIAVLSSPRPWIDVFALPEKFNIAVTERDLDPKVREMSITF